MPLRGISPLSSPKLLAVLSRMGHGDELVLADAHFPADCVNCRILRADGLRIHDLLDAIMPLWAPDPYVDDPIVMMAPVDGDTLDQHALSRYRAAIERHAPEATTTIFIPRFAFYERIRNAFAAVLTSETAKYGNILIEKGVIPVS